MEWMEVNGVALRYAVSGGGDKDLVLVHELGGALESWNDVLPALEKEFRVLRYDQRGFGLSEKSKGTLNINDMTGDIAALTAAVGMNGPCCVVGTAMGAGIAMAYSMHYPERVARQVLTSPATGTTADRASNTRTAPSWLRRMACGRRSMPVSTAPIPRFSARTRQFARYRARWLANDPMVSPRSIACWARST